MGNLVMNTMFKKILLCNRARLGLLRKKIFLNNILEVQNSTRQEKGWWESEAASLTCYKIDAWTTSHYQNSTAFHPQPQGFAIVDFHETTHPSTLFFLPQDLGQEKEKESQVLGFRKAKKTRKGKGKWNLHYFVFCNSEEEMNNL